MLKILFDLCKTQKMASIYTDVQNTNKFHYGTISYVNTDEIVISLISPNGNFDGFILIPTDLVYRIEFGGQYDEKMQKLITQSDCKKIFLEQNDLKTSLLKNALKTHNVISIELMDSGYYDVIGFVEMLDENLCKFRCIDEYGIEDGETIFEINDITKIRYLSEEENIIMRLR